MWWFQVATFSIPKAKMEEDLNLIIIILLFVLSCFLILVLNLMTFLNQVWLRPILIQSGMSSQGIKGPPYRFLHGNTTEINDMRSEAVKNPMELSHQMFPRIMPHVYLWTKVYGMNFLNWYGTRPQLVITDPELVKEVLSNKEGTYPKKFIQSYAEKFLGNGLFASQGEKWTKMRKLANHAFHGDCLKAMIPAMIASVEVMLQKWEQIGSVSTSIEIDAYQEFKILTSEVISRTAFGSSYKEGKNMFEMLMQLGNIVNRNNFKAGIPRFGIFRKLMWRSEDDVESDRLQEAIRVAIIKLIRKREDDAEIGREGRCCYGSDFLGSLLNAFHDSDMSRKISVDDLIDECKSFYVGGHETIASSLTWTVFLLAVHTEWQDMAREEVVEMFDHKSPCLDGVARLKIMTMIVNESLRLYPPALNLTREVEKDSKLGKFITLPAKMALSLPIIAIHHNPLLWGEDCHLFKPERFADGVSRSAAFFPFGFGPRKCVGSSFAIAEIKIALSMLLQRFRLSLSPSYVHSPFHMLTICPKDGLQIILERL
ncbi:Cytochrome P450 CYP749A22 [Linum perenne]